MKTLKTAKDFIAFFEAIPEDQWTTGSFKNDSGKSCAYGHIKTAFSGTARSLSEDNLADLIGSPISINDANTRYFRQYADLGSTPKLRILNALALADNNLWEMANRD